MRGKASCIAIPSPNGVSGSHHRSACAPLIRAPSLPDQQLIPSWALAMSSGEMAIRYSASRSVASSRGRVNSNLESGSLPASGIGEAGADDLTKWANDHAKLLRALGDIAPHGTAARTLPLRCAPAAHRSGRNRIAKLGTIGAGNVRFYETWIGPPVSTEGTSR